MGVDIANTDEGCEPSKKLDADSNFDAMIIDSRDGEGPSHGHSSDYGRERGSAGKCERESLRWLIFHANNCSRPFWRVVRIFFKENPANDPRRRGKNCHFAGRALIPTAEPA
jgi:hypothetical protein